MVRVKTYETTSTFVELMQTKTVVSFFPTRCILTDFQNSFTSVCNTNYNSLNAIKWQLEFHDTLDASLS